MHFQTKFRLVRRPLRSLQLPVLAAYLFAALALALAQPSISVQLMTDETVPADFGGLYSVGQLDNDTYSYGANFIIQISYSELNLDSFSLALSASPGDYRLAWRVAGTSEHKSFNDSLGADLTNLSGSDSGRYYRNDGTLQPLALDATRYRIGARSTPAASQDLLLQVTLTATLY